jgi:hypothetical protein
MDASEVLLVVLVSAALDPSKRETATGTDSRDAQMLAGGAVFDALGERARR